MILALSILLIVPAYAQSAESKAPSLIPVFTYKIVHTFPHDQEAFTQGLLFEDGALYEGTGLNGQSALRKVNLNTGAVMKSYKLPYEFFGEGITTYRGKIIQLTWQSHIGFVYDRDSFRLLRTFYYSTEGWGITNDGKYLIMSDGTANLYFLNPETFQEIRRVNVYDNTGSVTKLNELEYVKGEIFANVWLSDMIAKIDPKTGRITGWIDLKGLSPVKNDDKSTKTLNGIAYDAKNDRLLVTGKMWPYIFEIRLVQQK